MNRYLFILGAALFISSCAVAEELPPEGLACTQEAKLCSDGSAVGRTGPHCAFAPCPGEDGYVPPPEEHGQDGEHENPDSGPVEGNPGKN